MELNDMTNEAENMNTAEAIAKAIEIAQIGTLKALEIYARNETDNQKIADAISEVMAEIKKA